ncbi:MAG: hypothetical protein ACRD3J_04155 [Thermoanaerobaculia bacterium]
MGHGTAPAGTDLDDLPPIDDGTSARIGSPTPDPVGLDAKSGGGKGGSEASMADQILGYARRHRGSRIGNGQCFTLVDRALRGAHAQSAADYGSVSPDADYTWGTSVSLSDLQPGDVIQFRDYTFHKVVVTESDSATTTDELDGDRPHHTAVVESVDGHGAVTVLEQNAPEGSAVTRNQLYFTGGSWTSGHRTTTVTVHGTFWFFRPEAR